MLFLILLITGGVLALPVQEPDIDGESSRKVLGSSVVTSVSVIMDGGNGSKAIFTDAVGKPVAKPTTANQLASPINLLNPDRYEFYTFDDSGDLVKRLMTLDEIQGIIANGDAETLNFNTQSLTPEKKVNDVVNNVQNVLKEEIESHKHSEQKPMFDTPDVSSTWSMILPAIFGNSGDNINPDLLQAAVTPDTIMFEPNTEISTENSGKHESTTDIEETDQTKEATEKIETYVVFTKTPDTKVNRTPETSTPAERFETIIIITHKPELSSTKTTTESLQKLVTKEAITKPDIITSKNPLITVTQKPETVVTKQEEFEKNTKLPQMNLPENSNIKLTSKNPEIDELAKSTIQSTTQKISTKVSTTIKPEIPTTKGASTSTEKSATEQQSESIKPFENKISTEMPIISTTKQPELSESTQDHHEQQTNLPTTNKQDLEKSGSTTMIVTKPSQTTGKPVVADSPIISIEITSNPKTTTSKIENTATKYPEVEKTTEFQGLKENSINTNEPIISPTTALPALNVTVEIKPVSTAKATTETSTISPPTTSVLTTKIFKNLTETTASVIKDQASTRSEITTLIPQSPSTAITVEFSKSNSDIQTSTNKMNIFTTTETIEQTTDSYGPLSTFFIINDNKENSITTIKMEETTTEAIKPINTDIKQTTNAPKSESTEILNNTENVLNDINTTEQFAAETTTTPIQMDKTTLEPSTEKTVDIEKLAVTEILDQLLLSTTNIYQLNAELSERTTISDDLEKKVTVEDRFDTQTSTQSPVETVETSTMGEEIVKTTQPFIIDLGEMTETKPVDTTEHDLMESIEQLLSQAIGPVEAPVNNTIQTEKVQNIIANMSSRPMNEIQAESATAASSLFDNTVSSNNSKTNNSNFVNESMNSLLSQIMNDDKATTVENLTTEKFVTEDAKIITIQTEKDVENTEKPIEIISDNIPNRYEETELVNEDSTTDALPQTSTVQVVYKHESTTAEDITPEYTTHIINITIIRNEHKDNETKPSNSENNETNIQLNSTPKDVELLDLDNTNLHSVFTEVTTEKLIPTTVKEMSTPMEDITTNNSFTETTTMVSTTDAKSENQDSFTTDKAKDDFSVSTNTESAVTYTDSSEYAATFVSTTKKQTEDAPKESNKINDTTWTLVPTISPPNIEEQKPIKVHMPRPVDLVPQPQPGLGLEDSTNKLDSDIYRFVELCNELSFGFWTSVTNGHSTARSIFVSPFAAISLLAMVFLGARGATSGEMNEILRLDDMVTFNPHLIFRNVSESIEVSKQSGVAISAIIRELYSDKGKGKLLNFYKERARQFYDGHVEEVSFREISEVIRKRTNLLVKKNTWGNIPEYIMEGSISVRPPLVGVSVSIFETDCSSASTQGRDGEMHFVVLPSMRQRRLVPIPAVVYRTGFLAGYDPGLDATAVSIGTKDQTVSTIFVIPGQQGISAPGDGLARLETYLVESSFKQGSWSRLLRLLIPRPGLEVQIPRFAHRSVINASVALQRMGLKDLFSSDKADLRGLNGVAHELHLSDMLQINTFATCGENQINEDHHSEIYPATTMRLDREDRKLFKFDENSQHIYDIIDEPRDYQRSFHDPLHDPSYLSLPLPLRPRQARLPEIPRLRFDRPFLYFVRHNPTGLLLHMGRFNPRLLP